MIQKYGKKYLCICNVCGHQWLSRNGKEPWKCPNIECQTTKWNSGDKMVNLNCPRSDSHDVVKIGHTNGKQRFLCKDCKKDEKRPWTFYAKQDMKEEDNIEDDIGQETISFQELKYIAAKQQYQEPTKEQEIEELEKEKLRQEIEELEKEKLRQEIEELEKEKLREKEI